MAFIDLRELVSALLAVIFLSMGIGQFEKLQEFARQEAIKALKSWPSRHFFPRGYEVGSNKSHSFQVSALKDTKKKGTGF